MCHCSASTPLAFFRDLTIKSQGSGEGGFSLTVAKRISVGKGYVLLDAPHPMLLVGVLSVVTVDWNVCQ